MKSLVERQELLLDSVAPPVVHVKLHVLTLVSLSHLTRRQRKDLGGGGTAKCGNNADTFAEVFLSVSSTQTEFLSSQI